MWQQVATYNMPGFAAVAKSDFPQRNAKLGILFTWRASQYCPIHICHLKYSLFPIPRGDNFDAGNSEVPCLTLSFFTFFGIFIETINWGICHPAEPIFKQFPLETLGNW